MKIFADTSAFNAGVKEKNTKTNKITIVKNQKLATQNFLFNMYINFPFGKTYKDFPFYGICLNMILWNIGIVCFIIELHQFTSGTPYIPQKRKENLQIWSLYHSRDRITTPADLHWECESHRSSFYLFLGFFLQHNVFRYGFWLKW